jgi:hypothetical protein
MKRLIRAGLAAVLVAALAGCSSGGGATEVDLSGSWTFTFTGGYSDTPTPWTIRQVDTSISIVSALPGVTLEFTGTCDPSTGTFVTAAASARETFSGHSADGKLITGVWTVADDNGVTSGDLTGVRSR